MLLSAKINNSHTFLTFGIVFLANEIDKTVVKMIE